MSKLKNRNGEIVMECHSCELLSINGTGTHETGCPEAWKDNTISCFECGCEFLPETRFQNVCNDCQEYNTF